MKTNLKLKKNELAAWLLRAGLAFVFLYAAVSSLMHPAQWEIYLPNFLTKILAANTLIKLLAVYELILVVWLVVGWQLRYAAILCALTLGGIVMVNTSQLITTFRDVGLALAALALAAME